METPRSVAVVEASSTPRDPKNGCRWEIHGICQICQPNETKKLEKVYKTGERKKQGGVWVYEFIHVLSI